MTRRCRHSSFTLIEVVIAITLLAIAAGAITLGISKSVQATHLRTSKERIDRMLLQAFRFAAVSGHIGDVVLSKESDGTWEGYVNLWETDSKNLSDLAHKCGSIGRLSGIETICLNSCSVHKVTFRFFGGHGLSTVNALDLYDRELDPSDFGFLPENITHKERELNVILRPTSQEKPEETLPLQKYLLSAPRYLPFPDEYLNCGL